MLNGWVKLHRKLLENDFLNNDPTACLIFIKLILLADNHGELTTGRHKLSRTTGIRGVTQYKALKRLEKAKMVTQVSNTRFTLIRICNWSQYQANGNNSGNTTGNTTGNNGGNTYKEVITKNKNKNIYTNVYVPTVSGQEWKEYDDCFGVYKFARRDDHGYVLLSIANPPRVGKGDIVSRHKWVYQNVKGKIPDKWHINHINRIRGDDRPENLECLSPSDHIKKHWQEEKKGLAPRRIIGTPQNEDGTYGNIEVNRAFEYWKKTTGQPITALLKTNRQAAYNLLKKYQDKGLYQLIDGVALSRSDQYAPRIANFVQLQRKADDLILWGRLAIDKNKQSRGVTI